MSLWFLFARYFLLLLIVAKAGMSFAQQPTSEKLEREVQEIALELRCPICQGLSVGESQSEISVNMKNKIRQLLLEGENREGVMQYFEDRYGEWIRRTPKSDGLNSLIWVIPAGGILLGLATLLFFLFGRERRNAASKSTVSLNSTDFENDPDILDDLNRADRMV